jgi:PAS domain S-box-containing protein
MFAVNRRDTGAAQAILQREQTGTGQEDFIRLLEASPAMLCIAGPDGQWTFVSKSWLEFRGRALEQELGNGWTEQIHPEDREQCLREYRSAISAIRDFQLEYRIPRRDGTYFRIDHSGSRWFDSRRALGGYIGAIRAVTSSEDRVRNARRQLAMLSARERQILELVARGYATKEAAGRLGISYKTADSHRSHVLKKLGLHETASIVRFAVRSGLVSP